jgi:hypothetical protein
VPPAWGSGRVLGNERSTLCDCFGQLCIFRGVQPVGPRGPHRPGAPTRGECPCVSCGVDSAGHSRDHCSSRRGNRFCHATGGLTSVGRRSPGSNDRRGRTTRQAASNEQPEWRIRRVRKYWRILGILGGQPTPTRRRYSPQEGRNGRAERLLDFPNHHWGQLCTFLIGVLVGCFSGDDPPRSMPSGHQEQAEAKSSWVDFFISEAIKRPHCKIHQIILPVLWTNLPSPRVILLS